MPSKTKAMKGPSGWTGYTKRSAKKPRKASGWDMYKGRASDKGAKSVTNPPKFKKVTVKKRSGQGRQGMTVKGGGRVTRSTRSK